MQADIKAQITLNGTRERPLYSGCRPVHRLSLKDGKEYLTTGVHQYLGQEYLHPNESLVGTISFITPEAYPHCFSVGDMIPVLDGPVRVIGEAKVLEIYNEILKK